jgi:hypothetical protein
VEKQSVSFIKNNTTHTTSCSSFSVTESSQNSSSKRKLKPANSLSTHTRAHIVLSLALSHATTPLLHHVNTQRYRWHTGFPGGLKEKTARDVAETKPEEILRFDDSFSCPAVVQSCYLFEPF